MISYKLNESGIFHVEITDTVTFDCVQRFLSDFSKLKKSPKKDILFLVEIANADVTFDIDKIAAISQIAEQSTMEFGRIKTAVLVNNPKLTAYSMLFNQEKSQERIMRQTFSTKAGAERWLLE